MKRLTLIIVDEPESSNEPSRPAQIPCNREYSRLRVPELGFSSPKRLSEPISSHPFHFCRESEQGNNKEGTEKFVAGADFLDEQGMQHTWNGVRPDSYKEKGLPKQPDLLP
jgi:hypothetical protein